MKKKSTAWILWALFGTFGAHKFYVGQTFTGLIKMFTLNFCFFGLILDMPRISEDVDACNYRNGYGRV
ncbi:NINE protein [Bacillus paranthracis]|nr:NINE protein [Bacillus paranthracis]